MATEVGNIHIGLYVDVGESRRFTDVANIVERSSMRMNSALGNTSSAVRSLRGHMSQTMQFRIAQNSLRDLTRATDAATQLRAAIVGLSTVATGSLTGAFSAAYLINLADKARLLNNQIRTVTDTSSNFGAVQESLFDVSQRTRSSYEATTVLYSRMARATEHFSFSQQKLLRTTETIQKAFAIGGATPQEAQGAAIQLSQGIASDRFSGEEFRSVAENAPVLLQGIAKSLGVNIGKLREMAHAGELTAQTVTEAILQSSDAIDAAFAKMTPTVAQSWTLLDNALIRYVGEADQAYGVTKTIASAIQGLADNLEEVMYWITRVTGGLALVYGARKATMATQGAIGGVRAGNAAARNVVTGIMDESQGISNRLLAIEKERASVTSRVASANAAVVSSLQRQVEEGKKLVRDNALRVLQTSDGSKAQLQAIARYEKSIANLETRMQRLSAVPAASSQSAAVQKQLKDLDAERAVLIERQVLNTEKLTAAQKRLSVARRGWDGFVGAFGGGWGLAITATLAIAGAAMAKFAADAQRSAEESARITTQLKDLGYLAQDAATAMDGFAQSVAGRQVSKLQTELQDLQKDVDKTVEALRELDISTNGLFDKIKFPEFDASVDDAWNARTDYDINRGNAATAVGEALAKLRDEMIQTRGLSAELRKSFEEIALANPDLSSIVLSFITMGERLNALKKATDDWRESIKKIREDADKLPQEKYWNSRTEAAENQRKIAAAQELVVTHLVDEANLSDAERRIRAIMDKIVKDMEKAGAVINSAAVRADAERIYSSEKTSEAVDGFTDRIIKGESGGRKKARPLNADGSQRSTAYGLGQFIEKTWLDLFKRYFPDEAANLSRSQILELRTNTEKSRALIDAYARENAAVLQKAGLSVDEVALQLAHFLGPQGAVNVLKAAPGTAVSKVLSADAIKANPEVLGGGATVDDAIAYAQRRAGMDTDGTRRLDSRDAFNNALGQQQKMLEALIAETGIRSTLNPMVNDYGKALSTLEAAQKLLNEAQEQGTAAGQELKDVQQLLKGDFSALTPEARAQAEAMLLVATKMGEAAAAGKQVEESQERLRERFQMSSELGKDIFRGVISDLKDGASLGDILSNVFDKLIDKMIEMSLINLFDGTEGKAGGGMLGGMFNGFFEWLGFDDGGYTGHGGKKEVAGLVHKGEVVWSQRDVARAGGVAAVESLRRGYEDGGPVAVQMPSTPQQWAERNQSIQITMPINIDAANADAAGLALLRRQVEALERSLPNRIVQTVQNAEKRGGL
ncbi:tape measure protein [Shinella zoogloeoides]|uniref:tape measure protein n=1 Tax=Shinella zoogloeoides TaxID=352475 RepID=UPI00299F1B17|nr:tape measure protein [Shinella zoogloeoides]WPE19965.1 hypothetical protein ShzoTeo12_11450 [Shinella zoogloeoides]